MNYSSAVKNALRTATTVRPLKLATGGDVPAPAVDYGKPDDLGMFSHGAVVASKMPLTKGTPQQIKGYLTKQGVKPDEFKWSGYDEKLGSKPQVTREEVAKHFYENKPKIATQVLGKLQPTTALRNSTARGRYGANYADLTDSQQEIIEEEMGENPAAAKYSDYTLPGGKNYREHLLTLPEKRSANKLRADTLSKESHKRELSPDEFDELDAARAASAHEAVPEQYRSSHWDQPNVLAHLRLSDRDLPGKKKALHLEELQSDWAQEGRSKGFGGQSPEEASEMAALFKLPEMSPEQRARYDHLNAKRNGPIPQAPYVDSTSKWTDLGLKRALYEAAKGGHSKLLITPGEEQAKRYDLSKHISKIHYGTGNNLVAYGHNGERVIDAFHTPEELPGVIGKETADRLMQSEPKTVPDKHGGNIKARELSGLELRVGGEGMKAFYDKMLPQALQKLAKKHDPAAEVKLHHHMLDTPHNWDHLTDDQRDYYAAQNRNVDPKQHADYPGRQTGMHSLDITPQMRASILKGHPHFESGGAVPGYASGGAVNHAPSEAQKEAGNYKKKHISFQGLNIAIENEKGSIRKGKSPSGHQWRCVLPCDYGYIKGTVGADKDHVDCYVGPDKDSNVVFVVNQHNPGKGFDEHKCMLGFKTEEDALCCYVAAFSDGSGPKRIGSVATMSLDGFKSWLQRGNTTKSVAPGAIVDRALQLVAAKGAGA